MFLFEQNFIFFFLYFIFFLFIHSRHFYELSWIKKDMPRSTALPSEVREEAIKLFKSPSKPSPVQVESAIRKRFPMQQKNPNLYRSLNSLIYERKAKM
jgi:hypothetical protein